MKQTEINFCLNLRFFISRENNIQSLVPFDLAIIIEIINAHFHLTLFYTFLKFRKLFSLQ